jgi:hypothetical protein
VSSTARLDSHRVWPGSLSPKGVNFGAFVCELLCESLQEDVPVSILSRRCKGLEGSWFNLFFRDDFLNVVIRCSVKYL